MHDNGRYFNLTLLAIIDIHMHTCKYIFNIKAINVMISTSSKLMSSIKEKIFLKLNSYFLRSSSFKRNTYCQTLLPGVKDWMVIILREILQSVQTLQSRREHFIIDEAWGVGGETRLCLKRILKLNLTYSAFILTLFQI